MSLIYVGTNPDADASADILYHTVDLKSEYLSPIKKRHPGSVRYDFYFSGCNNVKCIHIAIPYQMVKSMYISSEEFLDSIEYRMFMKENNEYVLHPSGTEYAVSSPEHKNLNISKVSNQNCNYTLASVYKEREFENFTLSIKAWVEDLSINVSRSLFIQSNWSLDITLYGPIHPRSHIFLDENNIDHKILSVEQGYSYVSLPENTFPTTVFPPPLESFYNERIGNFYYTWVSGSLDPWYEQRMMITYSSYPNSLITIFIIGLMASIISSVILLIL